MTPRVLVASGWQQAGPAGLVELDETDRHHLAVVLRRRPGDPIELFDGEGRSIAAVLEQAGASSAMANPAVANPTMAMAVPPMPAGRRAGPRPTRDDGRVRARDLVARLAGNERIEPPPPLALVLAQGISSNDRMDWTIEKAVEVGVQRIVPLQTARAANRAVDERRRGHWQRIIASACAQSGRNHLPALDAVRSPDAWLATDPLPAGDHGVGYILEPTATMSLAEALSQRIPARQVRLACGPEAGFDPQETQSFVKAGWQVVGLGPRTLRTETAALIAMAIIQSQWGDLR